MANFVLVHGAWHGAWCWARVLPLLRAAGHGAHALTLTGVGERSHLLNPSIHLKTHIDDVLALIEVEELKNIILVGHSYAGMVVTGAADVLLRTDSKRINHLVYLDASIPLPGEAWGDKHTPETRAARAAAAARHPLNALPPPPAAVFGLEGADADWVNRRQTPHPFGPYTDPVQFDEARLGAVQRTFIDCTNPALPTIDASRQRARSSETWSGHWAAKARVIEMAVGHDPMVSHPEQLVQVLLSCVQP